MSINFDSQQVNSRHKVATFLKKTYSLLNIHNQHIVRWGTKGIGFVIVNQGLFQKEVLPKYFKHSHYSSFVRQLNMYSFYKIRQNNSESYFVHQCFSRDDQSKLAFIRRKPQKKKRNTTFQNTLYKNKTIESQRTIKSDLDLKEDQEMNKGHNKNDGCLNEIKVKEDSNIKQTNNEQPSYEKQFLNNDISFRNLTQMATSQFVYPSVNHFFSFALVPQSPTFCLFY